MGGTISVTSRLGEASVFVFDLPLPLDLNGEERPDFHQALRGARVLIVDDLPLNRRVLAEQLAASEIRHADVASAAAAIEALREARDCGDRFNVAILDYRMPDMSGEELGRLMKSDANWRGITLVMLTSVDDRDLSQRLEHSRRSWLNQCAPRCCWLRWRRHEERRWPGSRRPSSPSERSPPPATTPTTIDAGHRTAAALLDARRGQPHQS
jgi:CheY-like chemotaxis protein